MTGDDDLVVLVTAHPDDETMFFLPTIRSIQANSSSLSCEVWLICLTNGNYDGLGQMREKELRRVALDVLGLDKLVIVSNGALQDSPTDEWDVAVVSSVLERELFPRRRRHQQQQQPAAETEPCRRPIHILTFDHYGVSGHINHRFTHLGVQHFLKTMAVNENQRQLYGWQLRSIRNPVVKYLPVYHWFLVLLALLLGFGGGGVPNGRSTGSTMMMADSYSLYEPWLNWKCMSTHQSQFVWYRRLFVIFSVYTYHNQWTPLPSLEATKRY